MNPIEQLPQTPKLEQPSIENDWITLQVQRNGVTVERKFGGLHTMIGKDNKVEFCRVYYWYRELYPNGEPIKEERKSYSLQDLPADEVEAIEDQQSKIFAREELRVLSGFIRDLGYPGIINPARETLADTNVLPVDVEEAYPLKRDTRELTFVKNKYVD